MIVHDQDKYAVYFYGKKMPADQISSLHPGPLSLKQIHSDVCVEASLSLQNADAHWTNKNNESLVIQTADCLPVMIYLPDTDTILGIHAGWRGVEQRIVTKSLRKLHVLHDTPIHVYIGPHIQKKSFEVDKDVAQKIMTAFDLDTSHSFCEKKEEKYYIDLASLVVSELHALKLRLDVLYVSDIDTRTHPDFYSYRAGDRGGRNFSVINKKPAL